MEAHVSSQGRSHNPDKVKHGVLAQQLVLFWFSLLVNLHNCPHNWNDFVVNCTQITLLARFVALLHLIFGFEKFPPVLLVLVSETPNRNIGN